MNRGTAVFLIMLGFVAVLYLTFVGIVFIRLQ